MEDDLLISACVRASVSCDVFMAFSHFLLAVVPNMIQNVLLKSFCDIAMLIIFILIYVQQKDNFHEIVEVEKGMVLL